MLGREEKRVSEKPDQRWYAERRLDLLNAGCFWEEHVNGGALVEAFGILMNQASTDLNRYITLTPANMSYDKSGRRYARTREFESHFLKSDASRYLSQLRSTVAAIRRSEAIDVKYQSFPRPEPGWRWIAPHAFGFDGFRWHTRAFCLIDHGIQGFLLFRIIKTRGTQQSEVDPETDANWRERVTLEIDPHPNLSDTKEKVIALYYALKRLGLDTDPVARRPRVGKSCCSTVPNSAPRRWFSPPCPGWRAE